MAGRALDSGPQRARSVFLKRRFLTARKREVDTGTWREPSSETLAVYAERWLAHRDPARVGGGGRTRLSPSTFEGYRLNLRRHVAPAPGRADARVAPHRGRRRPHRRARGGRQGAGHGPQRDRPAAQDARRRRPAGHASSPTRPREPTCRRPRTSPARRSRLRTRTRSGRRCSSSRRSIRSAASPISSSSASSTSRSARAFGSASSARSVGATSTANGG